MTSARGYQGAYLIGFVIIAAVALRAILFYKDQLGLVIVLLGVYTLLYALGPWLAEHAGRLGLAYFILPTIPVILLSNLDPFADFVSLLYMPLGIQVSRAFPRRAAIAWMLLYVALLSVTLVSGMGWLAGLALVLLILAVLAFLVSYDFLFARAHANRAESQRLLADLQSAHEKLQQQAAHAQELAATRERNRLARELHDSVSQALFGIILTSQSARLLIEGDPARVAREIERLQEMTSSALAQLRALIAELHPQ